MTPHHFLHPVLFHSSCCLRFDFTLWFVPPAVHLCLCSPDSPFLLLAIVCTNSLFPLLVFIRSPVSLLLLLLCVDFSPTLSYNYLQLSFIAVLSQYSLPFLLLSSHLPVWIGWGRNSWLTNVGEQAFMCTPTNLQVRGYSLVSTVGQEIFAVIIFSGGTITVY